jgi:hypothetical protein
MNNIGIRKREARVEKERERNKGDQHVGKKNQKNEKERKKS